MSTPISHVFPEHLLDQVEDVSDLVALTRAQASLSKMGFVAMDPIEITDQQGRVSTQHAWAHPDGIFVASKGHEDGNIYNTRVAALADTGWEGATSFNRVRAVVSYLLDGTRAVNLTVAADQPDDRTLLTFIRDLTKSKARIEGFDRWAELAKKGETDHWLFCVGYENLEYIQEQHGIEKWLARAPKGLVDFTIHRQDCGVNNAWSKRPMDAWEKGLHGFLRREGVASGTPHPSGEQKRQIQEWVHMGTGQAKWDRCWKAQEGTGIMLPHVLGLMLNEYRAQTRLLKWVRSAPVRSLEQAFLKPLPSGRNPLTETVIAGAIQGAAHIPRMGNLPLGRAGQPDAKPALDVAVEALETIIERIEGAVNLGVSEVLEHLLGEGNYPTPTDREGFKPVFVSQMGDFLSQIKHLEERLGERKAGGTTQGDSTPSRLEQMRHIEEAMPEVGWGPVISLVKQWAMDESLPKAEQAPSLKSRGARL